MIVNSFRFGLGLPAAVTILVLCYGTSTHAEDWFQFRGPTGEGYSTATAVPLTWSESEHIRWAVDVPGLGWSSPVTYGPLLWLTTATDDGASLRLLSYDRDTGKMLKNVEVFHLDDPGSIHKKNSHASPTPWLEADRVYVHFGAHGTACLDFSGKILWSKVLKYNHRHGPAASPVVVDDLLILACDGGDVQYVTALNKQTGEEVWKSEREGAMAYCTPLPITVDGRRQLVAPGGEWVIAYEPLTGKEIWKVRYPEGYSNVPRPVYGNGLVYVSSGYNTPVLYAIDPTGEGDITDSHVRWKMKRGAPLNPSPIVVRDSLYVCADNGIATCLDCKTGKQIWQQRMPGNYSASWTLAANRLYITNEDAVTTVIEPGRKFEKLAENTLPGRSLSTLTPVDHSIYLRTDSKLYRIED